jgi:hypothetical protein
MREPRDESECARVWYGNISSGYSMMINLHWRDELRDEDQLRSPTTHITIWLLHTDAHWYHQREYKKDC